MTRQPIPTVTAETVARVSAREFPGAEPAAVAAALAAYGSQSWHGEVERVQLAILKLAGGDWERLHHYVRQAQADHRNVLAWAEYPGYCDLPVPVWELASEQVRVVVVADREQYQNWLQR